MEAAIKAVHSGSGINKAAHEHGVPRTTLKDRLSGKVVHGRKPGPQQYLNSTEERELGLFLKECAGIGYGKTRRDVMQIAQSVAAEKGVLRKSRITHGWWSRFLERQGNLCLRKGDSTAHSRMDAINKETLTQYFKLLKDVLDECGLMNNPAQIYNVDESGIPFDFKPPNVVAVVGSKKIRYRQAGKKGQVTIVGCANATGQAIPPMVIFDAKNLNHAWTKNEVPGTKYGLSDNGWINTDLFEGWLEEHFIKHAVSGRPLLLLLDGHCTHYQPDVIRFARDHDVVMLCLPPHTTHEAQPLDVGVFSSLKSQWTNVCHDYFHKNPGKVITKFNFNLVFSQAWLKALVPSNIIAGFKKSGVYPYDPTAIKVPDEVEARPQPQVDPAANSMSQNVKDGSNDGDGDGACDNSEGDEDGSECICDKDGVCTRDSGSNRGGSDEGNEDEGSNVGDKNDEGHMGDGNDIDNGDDGSNGGGGGYGGGVCEESLGHNEKSDLFDQDKLELYETRFREGYNLFFDNNYVNWLKLHHPEALPPDNEYTSLTDIFSSVTPETPVAFIETQQKSDSICVSNKSSTTPVSEMSTPLLPVPGNSGNSVSSDEDSTISKYLVSPVANTPCTKKPVPRARLLTSADSLAQLEEKERKKREEQEIKEQKKREREEKKKKREIELQQKAEERAKKVEERAIKKARIEEERLRKAEMKAQKIVSRAKESRKKTGMKNTTAWEPSTSAGSKSAMVEATSSRSIRSAPAKQPNTIDTNTCCMCNARYEDDIVSGFGAEWISCSCGRWLHEDCTEDYILDKDGKERFCSVCLDLFS